MRSPGAPTRPYWNPVPTLQNSTAPFSLCGYSKSKDVKTAQPPLPPASLFPAHQPSQPLVGLICLDSLGFCTSQVNPFVIRHCLRSLRFLMFNFYFPWIWSDLVGFTWIRPHLIPGTVYLATHLTSHLSMIKLSKNPCAGGQPPSSPH